MLGAGFDVLVEEIGEGVADSDVTGFALRFEGGRGGGGERFVFGGGEGFGAAEFGAEEGFKGGGRGFASGGRRRRGRVGVGVEKSKAFAEA